MAGRESRFSACHPAVCFCFFAAAILTAVLIQHPAYLAVSALAAALLLLTLRGRRALPLLLGLLPLFAMLSALNPLFNTGGERVLFRLFGRPYTLEALFYGMAVSGMLVTALLWFSCYNEVMTGDKFTCLFGNLAPALSLLLVMVLRLVPAYRRKAHQISGARRCIGKAAVPADPLQKRIEDGSTQLSVLTSWALEGAVVTADSMRSRGYGTAKRTSFALYHMTGTDRLLLAALVFFLGCIGFSGFSGWTAAAYTPVLQIAPVSGMAAAGLAAYALLLMLPAMMNLWEDLKWIFFQSRI